MSDIAPALLEQIQEEFRDLYKNNAKCRRAWARLTQGHGRYDDANMMAIEIGEMLSQALNKYITADALPEGKMFYNIAMKILEPTLRNNYELVAQICQQAQLNINKAAGIGLGAIAPELNEKRIKGIIDKISDSPFEEVSWLLGEPIVNFTQSVVDDSIKQNADFLARSGVTPIIKRTAEPGACKWCQALAGEYNYTNMPITIRKNIFRRHENCRCNVEYIMGTTAMNVWDKTSREIERAERFKRINGE